MYLTIPTAGSHPELLDGLVTNSGLPRDRVVLVRTRPDADLPAGCSVVDDFGEINIQRWWNKGISEAVSRGATVVAVANDDVSIGPTTMSTMLDALAGSGAVISTPSRPGLRVGLHQGITIPYEPVMWGCLWALDTRCELRPNERYSWWFGDVDLDIRARRDFSGVVSCEVEFQHHFAGEATNMSPELLGASEQDSVTFMAVHGDLLSRSRWIQMSMSEKIAANTKRTMRKIQSRLKH